ncbi:MAG: phosphate acyltransferase PlsX [Eubacteriales bacterium]|jgi:glycerol-3-phosphate acyltransferase PlsX|nr:phosphate acyltransferase PlsX [Eubacteriales bacterium]MDD4104331.1 phosphate acyltransferase PlsX [Eubacteriales bacterium]MDD4709722.1 phosphate acyltransferase PlsX [Eubacteriales bacterium]NLO14471.1 phosphate acyltransferase PlsX [Clostridiales bacterium]
MVHILVDAMGGDHAPEAPVLGAIEALQKDPDIRITLAGELPKIEPFLKDHSENKERLSLLNAPETITNHDVPSLAIRQKKESSIVKGMLALRANEVDGFVSAGSTGAILLGGMLRLGRIPGIERPALAPLMPNGKGQFLLIDCGANVDCRPEWLVQFGIMGDAYMRTVAAMPNPRIGLVNNGEEAEKGNALTRAAYALMQEAPFNFVGNIEARYITADKADVIVCDGFDGNLILKFMEGVAGTLLGIIKQELLRDTRSKLGAMLAKPAFKRVKTIMDYTEVGGAPLLGVQGAVVKAHGSSNAHANASAIRQCVNMARGNVAQAIFEQIKTLHN